ncbi:MAG: cation:proton antiporter [Gammaproteobacteria bacterium]|nr:cation:proton antiporter [Gammaproteobacteria bacterium]NNJ97386.1 cation:proton antiporter [Gammaproteobacteria bacterium]
MDNIIYELVLIFAGAAALATLFLYLKQPIILAYIALGVAIGPSGLRLIDNPEHIEHLSHVGIILLLFLIGLNLRPDRMIGLFGKVSMLTLATSLIFMSTIMLVAMMLGYAFLHSLIIGAALMFSSTIIGLKLLPTTTLHHKHRGEMMVSVLLLQDILAIVIILLISGGQENNIPLTVSLLFLKLILLTLISFFAVKYIITALYTKFDTIREHTFLMSLGWGLLIAGAAEAIGLSFEMGAFVAGVSIATLPISLVIAEELKPLRDFFLILFFFSIGAQFDLMVMKDVVLAGALIAFIIVLIKPLVYRWGFNITGEKDYISAELGIRLGQASEFSLLVAYSALISGVIDLRSTYLIQTVVILTFVISTYWVINKYPTPISSVASQRRD